MYGNMLLRLSKVIRHTFTLSGVFSDAQFFPSTARSSNTSDIWIGAINRAVGDEYMEGSIDDIGIWNRALTQQEVSRSISAASSPCTVSSRPRRRHYQLLRHGYNCLTLVQAMGVLTYGQQERQHRPLIWTLQECIR